MQIWSTLLVALQVLSALAMIVLVLIQHGKGADMGASFGSGASGSLFGATGSANFLSRSTAIFATVFFAATLGLSVVANRGGVPRLSGDSARVDSILGAPVAASAASATVAASGPSVPASAAASSSPSIPTR